LHLSEYLADPVPKGFTRLYFLVVIVVLNGKMALGSAILVPLVVVPVGQTVKKIRALLKISQTGLGTSARDLQETVAGTGSVKAFWMEDFEIAKFENTCATAAARNLRGFSRAVATRADYGLLGALVIPLLLFCMPAIRSSHGL